MVRWSKVLCEALTRDEFERRKAKGEKVRKKEISQKVESFIQNVHHFRDDALKTDTPPYEHVVIFDEAQRACGICNRQPISCSVQERQKRI